MTACTSFLAFFAEQTLAFAVKMHSRPDRWPQIVRFASGRADSLANRRFVNDLSAGSEDLSLPALMCTSTYLPLASPFSGCLCAMCWFQTCASPYCLYFITFPFIYNRTSQHASPPNAIAFITMQPPILL